MGRARIALLLLIAAAATAFYAFDGHHLLRPENLQALVAGVQDYYVYHPAHEIYYTYRNSRCRRTECRGRIVARSCPRTCSRRNRTRCTSRL